MTGHSLAATFRAVPATQRHARFPSTRWTLVVQAARTFTPESRAALEELCRAYWSPLYAYLLRTGTNSHEAKDLVQGYLARLIERQDLETLAPERGRFRSYLLVGLRHYLVSESRRELAQKRGAGAVFALDTEGFDAESVVDTSALAPDTAYDRRWAELLLRRGIESLQREYTARGRETLFLALKPALTGGATEDHAAWGRQLGMTPGAVAVTVHRLRGRLRELVRLEVAQTVQNPEDVDDEMRNLLAVLSN